MRDQPRLQDGRPPHQLHQPHAHQHEQTEDHQGQVGGQSTNRPENMSVFFLVPCNKLHIVCAIVQ